MKKRASNKMIIGVKTLLLVACIMVASTTQAKLPVVPFPDNAEINVVGEQLVVNGLPLMAYEYHSRDSIEKITEFYKQEWKMRQNEADSKQPYLETTLLGWTVLSRLEKGHNITVQIRSDGIYGQQVLVGISPLPTYLVKNKKRPKEYSIPQLGLATILSLVESVDRDLYHETYWMESRDSIDLTSKRYEQYFTNNQLTVRKKRMVNDVSGDTHMALLMASSDRESIRMDLMSIDGKTRMVVTRQKKHHE